MSNDEIIRKTVEALTTALGHRLRRIVLYGSMARDDAAVGSDIDCLAVVDRIDRELLDALDETAAAMLLSHGAVCAFVPVTEERYLDGKNNPLLVNIEREGRVLWPKTA
ncbi:MAG TPA: nucleotidyltransferase domain-containing protein [Spirochaetota bacterium]|jgi:predicted nucleotidyltransferase|nr:nucleotidyltransferase domain-containing protein [Spirochaetota bacterium]HNU92659.1 nucleotidyltransferase domain-containing protein [Spirochaetota bacterium]HPV98996.1 nucleotidyltransferase domain-containing protein [Spirochaetota bacterium]